MSIANDLNINYGNLANEHNPVFQQALEILESSGLLSEHLSTTSLARKPGDGSIAIYNNAAKVPNAIALEVIVDAISRGIMLGYQQGFAQAIPSDGASNINFETTPLENATLLKLALGTSTNVHEAIVQIAQEINAIKVGLQGLGVTLLPIPATPSPKANLS
jgi:hypothetical protein